MLSLRELQERFAAELSGDASKPVTPWIRGDGIEPRARLDIYRNNLHEAFVKTLALEFPVIQRLVGKDYFRQLALAFLARHPSASGDLHHIGAPFSGFLGSYFVGTRYLYLADVAALEWAYQECLVAADVAPLDPMTLREVSPDVYAALRFALRPDCRLVHSAFPVVRIWKANQPESTGEEIIDLDQGPDQVLVRRIATGIELRRLTNGDFRLLAAFAAGKTLSETLEAGVAADPQFELGAALRRCIELGVLAQMTLPQPLAQEPIS